MMSKEQKAICGRAEDLVSYLYGESSEIEVKGFERHLAECPACRQQQLAFASLAPAFETTRREAAASFTPLSLDFLRATAARRRQSAVTALREFFTLAPLWLKAGTATASAAFVALVGLAAANSEINIGRTRLALGPAVARTVERVVTIERPIKEPGTYTSDEVEQLLAERERMWQAKYEAQIEPQSIETKLPKRAQRGDVRVVSAAAPTKRPQRAAPRNERREQPSAIEEDALSLSDLLSQVK